jgi:hypothetical protein
MIDPEEFGVCFLKWVKAVMKITEREVITIDGKTAKGQGMKEMEN